MVTAAFSFEKTSKPSKHKLISKLQQTVVELIDQEETKRREGVNLIPFSDFTYAQVQLVART